MPIGTASTQKVATQLGDYFALKQGSELIGECFEKIELYQNHIEATGRLDTWKRIFKNYYFGIMCNARIKTTGEKNQFLLTPVNHFANILDHVLNNITGSRPSLKARAKNSDFKSLAQAKVGNQVLEYYLTEKDMENVIMTAAELSEIFGEGFVEMLFDPTEGEDVAVDLEGKPIKDGEIQFSFYAPLDVIRDYAASSPDDCEWFILRKWVNKFTLAAKYPAYEKEILSSGVSMTNMKKVRMGHPIAEGQLDEIPLYRLIHLRNSILPNGRLVEFIENEDAILLDSDLPHKKVIHRIAPDEQHGTIWGYTRAFDLLPVQENLNMLYSIIASNQAMFGVQSLLVPKNANIDYNSMQGGLKVVSYDVVPGMDTKPSALQLTATPKEIFEHINHLIQQMELLMGVNSVIRGQPEASLKSGAALALMASQAIQFLSSFQKGYTKLMESCGTGLLDILKTYAKTPRLISIAGKANQQYIKEFTGQDLQEIDRVSAEVTNPMMQTTAGKLQIAQDLLANNLVPNAKEYLNIIETGTMEPLTEGTEQELLLIRSENEELAQGQQVMALVTDNHFMHIQEHKNVASNLDARMNPNVLNALNAHMLQHQNLAMALSPLLAAATGQQLMAPPPQGGNNAVQMTDQTPPAQKAGESVKPAGQPTNPLTHQKAAPGGM